MNECKRPCEKCIRDKAGRIVAWQAGYTENEIEKMIRENPGWYRSLYFLDE